MKKALFCHFARIFPVVILLLGTAFIQTFAQVNAPLISGNMQVDAQYYRTDTLIGTHNVPEKLLMNAFTNLLFSHGGFTAAIRFESYLNPVLGYDPRFEGTGLAHRSVSYKNDYLDITAGNYYEQFGNGSVLRAYEDWNLGTDNALDGIRIRFNPSAGLAFKAIYGKQRYFWSSGPGIVRGIDAEMGLNELIKPLNQHATRFYIGASAVSKYQKDELIIHSPGYRFDLPLNVGAFASRVLVTGTRFTFEGEYARKINDPTVVNHYIYKPGNALFLSASYFIKGLSIHASAKHTDNMSFKSKRTESGNVLDINFLPPINKQHTYAMASMYPYATQPNGEVAYQGQFIYQVKKNTKIGGKYGTNITVNYSWINSLNRRAVNDTTPIGAPGTLGYKARLFDAGDEKYFRELAIDISRRMTKDLKITLQYINLFYNIAVIQGHTGDEDINAHIFVSDLQYKFTSTKSVRCELQHLQTVQDRGNWVSGLVEYTIAPKWFFGLADQWNYGNSDPKKKLHYYTASMGYSHQSSRIALTWGRQRDGVVCVGGVCRHVPASNGLMITITSSF